MLLSLHAKDSKGTPQPTLSAGTTTPTEFSSGRLQHVCSFYRLPLFLHLLQRLTTKNPVNCNSLGTILISQNTSRKSTRRWVGASPCFPPWLPWRVDCPPDYRTPSSTNESSTIRPLEPPAHSNAAHLTGWSRGLLEISSVAVAGR